MHFAAGIATKQDDALVDPQIEKGAACGLVNDAVAMLPTFVPIR
jgi:hypothetical protein